MNKKRVLENSHILPLVAGWRIQSADLFDESYIWAPKLLYPVFKTKITTIQARSVFGHHGLFKPSVAEVINSIPDDLLTEVDYFQISEEPTFDGFDTSTGHSVAVHEGFHLFKVDLFRGGFRWLRSKRLSSEEIADGKT